MVSINYSTPPLSFCQSLSILANIFPINSSISVIWKQKTRATSHAPVEAFPITSVYRKFRKDTILAPITWFFLASMEPVYSPVERQNRGGGYREDGLSAPLRRERNELVRDICMTLHISRATLYRYINTGRGNA